MTIYSLISITNTQKPVTVTISEREILYYIILLKDRVKQPNKTKQKNLDTPLMMMIYGIYGTIMVDQVICLTNDCVTAFNCRNIHLEFNRYIQFG